MRHPIYGVGTVVLLAFAALLLGPEKGAGAQDNGTVERASDAVVGASVAVPEDWSVERERYTSDGTYGFTLWKPQEDPEAAEDHGGDPGVRVALAPELEPGGIEGRVRDRLAELSDVPAKRTAVIVGEGKHDGVAVGPIPGSTPSTEVYVAVDGRVYQINAYGERLDAAAKKLLSTLKFGDPSRPVASLRLPDGESSAAFAREDGALVEQEEAARREVLSDAPEGARTAAAAAAPAGKEKRIAEGCWRAASNFYFQTQHGERANARTDDGIGKGWTIIGRPNFWGQYTHGNLNYGRCVSPSYVNDKFAIDYPLNKGDVVFSPFKSGTVTFAGRNNSHKNFGIFVVIKADNGGKYVSMSAHLTALASGIRPGARVTDETVIGFAGNTGDNASIRVGEVHLHQAFYRYPKYLTDGSPYGGAGLQAVYHHYLGTASRPGGVYKFGWTPNSTTKSEGSLISN